MPLGMTDMKECPLCGGTMRLTIRDVSERIPGTAQTTTRKAREWVCPECDNWEEAEDSEEDRA
jgi:YgiT-type zinc finger domain-containing protein